MLGSTGQLAVLASEEDEDIIHVPDGQPVGKYVVNFDPLDGSSNINANVNIGTIFSVLPRVTQGGTGTLADCLQPGHRQVCAGYVMYGSSTMLVFTTGHANVHGERVQKLDVFAHETIYRVLGSTGQLAVLASEEDEDVDRKSTRLNSSHIQKSRMPSSA